ncbi:hypothetical protein [Pararhizobium antarcticum]|uniref:Uncharacterized protein n=1 Tax=Pararhizobium antarcticum TaxID=1798805 RepID=A0A657LXG2_9HYPH|nr:hypothetical protein [Pararhizobium antarcticum]OJF96757.1 hypothetical protein AX761_15680 [Rhizobium sp. 58]OJG00676.1 hypothetical protein AX760_25250 [Pararhizobium antarcticum]
MKPTIGTAEAEDFELVFSGSDLTAMQRLVDKVFAYGSTNSRIVMPTDDAELASIAIAAGAAAARRASRILSVWNA